MRRLPSIILLAGDTPEPALKRRLSLSTLPICLERGEGNIVARGSIVSINPDVRDTRRIVGDYTLTDEDALQGRTFEDGIGRYGNW
ncbi:hypothetical protein FHT86_002830 [Rhizobium sp. BK313]|uniref:FAD-dependent oxidoreductase n=1 Tax=Rhizobium sp. BK313 TaxID=2587081 RepID=UPI0017B42A78|nr:FAD-dependent oxidoreductase [Rhizobium sp. BK313]MBB3454531.1 hypothetical protein [Rhizobium sp. BK313]